MDPDGDAARATHETADGPAGNTTLAVARRDAVLALSSDDLEVLYPVRFVPSSFCRRSASRTCLATRLPRMIFELPPYLASACAERVERIELGKAKLLPRAKVGEPVRQSGMRHGQAEPRDNMQRRRSDSSLMRCAAPHPARYLRQSDHRARGWIEAAAHNHAHSALLWAQRTGGRRRFCTASPQGS